MKIVAFLQNMWVYPRSAPTVERHAPVSEERERMIEYCLFSGCLTGRRLRSALGEDLCDQITWQEANPTVATDPKKYYAPDPNHIRAVLDFHKPDAVICFTRAGEAVLRSLCSCAFYAAPHPAAQQADVMEKLKAVAEQLRGERFTDRHNSTITHLPF